MPTKTMLVNGAFVTSPLSVIPPDFTDQVLDSQWAKNAFLLSDTSISDGGDKANRYYSSAESKFTDTRLGCNIGINAKPQFTRYSDIRAKGRNTTRNDVSLSWTRGNIGMGRYYSEAIDDPSQTIYLRFGVPQFSGLMSFLSRAYDADMVSLARTGRASSLLYKAGKGIGTITSVMAFPQLSAFVLLGKAVAWMFSRPTSKFYTLKPTMHTYWATVENLVNNIAVTRGLLPKVFDENGDKGDRLGQPYRIDSEQLEYLNQLMPDVFGGGSTIAGLDLKTNNYIQVAAIANRAQRVANQVFMDEYNAVNQSTATDYTGYLQRGITGNGSHSTYITSTTNSKIQQWMMGSYTVAARLNAAFMLGNYKRDAGTPESEVNPQAFEKKPDTTSEKFADVGRDRGFMEEFIEHMDAEFRDGSQFAVFKVDHTGSVQESFGNTVQESDLANKINQISSTARQMRFTMAEGNMTGTAIEGMLSGVIGAVADVGKGLLDGATFGFSNILAGLGGAGYVDIPKYWQSSTATLPKSTYTMQLISPYGNVVSQLQNIYIPLCMLLAGALPISTGKSSYTSPYLCQLFDRGRCQVQTGMIESLSVSRGTSNLAFNTKGNPLAIDVSFTIVDLSSIMHMPISSGGVFDIDTNMSDDSLMADYISVLAGQDLYTQMYDMPKAQLRLAKALTQASRLTSPAAWAGVVHDSMPSILKNVIEGTNRGSAVITGSAIPS
jgi:hypothetical protein